MDRIDNLNNAILLFRNERDWKQFHTPENLAKSIVIESTELLEQFQWGDSIKVDEVNDELADILIYSFLMAESLGVHIEEIMLKKIKKNKKRFPVEALNGRMEFSYRHLFNLRYIVFLYWRETNYGTNE